jgi:CRP-like cAMP-binding protein
MMVVLGEKNVNLNRKLELLTLKGMREKIASYLINESGERGSSMFQIMLNRTELADYLNVSRTSMCRELARMKEEGLIDYYGNSFKIVNKELLAECLE